MDSEFDLRSYLAILRRRYWLLILPVVLIGLASVGFAYSMAPVYQASATILVESQQIPTDLASPTVTANANERVHVIRQRLLARDNLLQIADKFHLYAFDGPNLSPTSIVSSMRNAIAIRRIDASQAAARRGTGVIGFTVSFDYRDANLASQVTNELVSSILSQNIETRLSRASETAKFFEQQKSDLEKRLLALENKIADFKRNNESALPETLATRRTQLAQLQDQINAINQKIQAASITATPSALTSDNPQVQQLGFTLQAKQLELQSYEDQRAKIAPLAGKGYIAANRLSDLDRRIAIAKINVKAIEAQIAAAGGAVNNEDVLKQLKTQLETLQKQSDALNASIRQTPLVQVELNTMNRDYQNLQTEYRQAQAKLEDALIGERLEQDRQAERFEVIEQATAPDSPTSPNRPKIIMAGLIAGIAAGFGLVVLLEMVDTSVRTAADLEKGLQLRPIATIPYITTQYEKRQKNRQLIIFLVVSVAIIAVLLIAIDIYYMPLDLLAERVWQRLVDFLSARGLIR